jgi:hypothetical protein
MPLDIATTKPILAPLRTYWGVFNSADTSTIGLIKELDKLLILENYDGYIFQASPYSHENAKRYIELWSTFRPLVPRPEFIPDGEGGIDIEWVSGNKKMTLSCRGRQDKKDYIYWEHNGEYDAKDFTLSRLLTRIDWLNHA